jgi:hypothetical protein
MEAWATSWFSECAKLVNDSIIMSSLSTLIQNGCRLLFQQLMLTQEDAGKTFIAEEAEKRGSLPIVDYYAFWKVTELVR